MGNMLQVSVVFGQDQLIITSLKNTVCGILGHYCITILKLTMLIFDWTFPCKVIMDFKESKMHGCDAKSGVNF